MRADLWKRMAPGLALAVWAGTAAAQGAAPDWPCVQPQVAALSIGQMWAGPIPQSDAPADPEVQGLAQQLAARRLEVEEAAATAAAAVQGLDADARAERLGEIFAAVLDRINSERGAIIAGIGRYARRQTALAERIEDMQASLTELGQAAEAQKDLDRIEELQDTLTWDTRTYKERAQSLTYVCETPVLLEQRAFAIARALAELL